MGKLEHGTKVANMSLISSASSARNFYVHITTA